MMTESVLHEKPAWQITSCHYLYIAIVHFAHHECTLLKSLFQSYTFSTAVRTAVLNQNSSSDIKNTCSSRKPIVKLSFVLF